jgi:hypothetical protein
MWIYAALTDHSKIWQPLKKRGLDSCPLPDQDQNLGIMQTVSQGVYVLDMIGPDPDLVARKLFKTF